MLFADRVQRTRLTPVFHLNGAWPAGVPIGGWASATVFVLAVVGSLGWHLATLGLSGLVVGLSVSVLFSLLLLSGSLLVVAARNAGPAGLGWRAPLPQRHHGWPGLILPAAGVLMAYLITGHLADAPAPAPRPEVPFGTSALHVLHAATLLPLAEESLFRGLLLGGLLRRWAGSGDLLPTLTVIIANGLASGLLHAIAGPAPLAALLQWFVVGTACAALAARDGDLIRAGAAHALVSTTAAIAVHFG